MAQHLTAEDVPFLAVYILWHSQFDLSACCKQASEPLHRVDGLRLSTLAYLEQLCCVFNGLIVERIEFEYCHCFLVISILYPFYFFTIFLTYFSSRHVLVIIRPMVTLTHHGFERLFCTRGRIFVFL